MKLYLRPILLCLGVVFAGGCVNPSSEESGTLRPGQNVLPPAMVRKALAGKVDFSTQVRPILQAKCVVCHDREAQPHGLHLENRAAAVKSGALGGLIVPGHPERSALLTHINGAHLNVKAMPPVGERLTSEETAILQRWIQQGAQWPVTE